MQLRLADGRRRFLGGDATDELAERRRPSGGPVERGRGRCGRRRGRRRGRQRPAAAGGRRLVRVGRRGRRRRYTGIGRELPAVRLGRFAGNDGGGGRRVARVVVAVAVAVAVAAAAVVVRRERVVDVRHEPGQRTAGHRPPFGRGRRRVRERTRRRKPFGELRALQFDVGRGHAVRGTAEFVQRETATDEPRRDVAGLFAENRKKTTHTTELITWRRLLKQNIKYGRRRNDTSKKKKHGKHKTRKKNVFVMIDRPGPRFCGI